MCSNDRILLKISSVTSNHQILKFVSLIFVDRRTNKLSIVNIGVMFLFVILYTPLVRTFIRASIAREFRLGIDAFKF